MLPPMTPPVHIENIQESRTTAQNKGKLLLLWKIPGILSAQPQLTKFFEDIQMKHLGRYLHGRYPVSSEKVSMLGRELHYKKHKL